ncbi:MAG: aminotransferase class V-fold PLP-dependent enzyme [Cyclobacteriaceae bacterium]
MTSRREFIKKGLLSSVGVLPLTHLSTNSPLEELKNASSDDELFALVRQQLHVPKNRIYLNTGSLGPSPVVVTDEVHAMMQQLEMNPAMENWGDLGERMEQVRVKVGEFINTDADNVILTRNTTEGLSLIGQSLKMAKGDEILTTTHEHGGGEVGLEYLAATQGAVVKKLQMPVPAPSKEAVIEAVVNNITPRTKVVMLSHVNTLTGLKMPFEEISKITKAKGILLIADGAQAPGLIKVDVKSMGVDAYAASGHKWMLGPKETGFVYWSKELQQEINPVFTSSGFASYSASSGTRNVALISGLGVTIDWLNLIGKEKIENRCLELRSYCLSRLKELKGIVIISPEVDSLSTGIVSFTLKEGENKTIAAELAKEDIIVKVLPRYNGIRISCHMFISKSDIDRFIKSFSQLV